MSGFFSATVSRIDDFPEARVRRLWLRSTKGLRYLAGQYLHLHFPGLPVRAYSIANAPLGGAEFELHLRRSASPLSEYVFTQLKAGDEIDLEGPYGDMVYHPGCSRPLIAVAGGTGLSAMKAIIEAALADPSRQAEVRLYWGAKTLTALYLHREFTALSAGDSRFSYSPVLSDESLAGFDQGLVGETVQREATKLSQYRIYGAGPEAMLRHLHGIADQAGVDPAFLHTDLNRIETRA